MRERVDAPRRWARLLDAARPGDVQVILAGLPETDLVALLDNADAPVCILICEYALPHGSTPVVVALAWRVAADDCDEGIVEPTGYLKWHPWLRFVAEIRTRGEPRGALRDCILLTVLTDA